MKYLYTTFIFLTTLISTISAQHFEAGIQLGTSNFIGDLSHQKWYIQESNFAGGALVRYNINGLFAIRAHGNYGFITGSDQNAKNENTIRRGLNFKSTLTELALIGEINIPGYQPDGLRNTFSAYFFFGIGTTFFNSKGNYDFGDGYQDYALADFQTEKVKYSLNTIIIPYGLGIKYAINDKINIGVEFGFRHTFTDYLDDASTTYQGASSFETNTAAYLSNPTLYHEVIAIGNNIENSIIDYGTDVQRADPNNNDKYTIISFQISYNFIDSGLMGIRNRGGSKEGCKATWF